MAWFRILTNAEKLLVAFLILVALVTGYRIVDQFYEEYSIALPVTGGTYIEGAVGKLGIIDPLYVQHGTITHDITQLVFSGLTKYDPNSGDIVADIADFSISDNKREYTFVIKEGALWHDGTPVTSADVLFTYNTVLKDPAFNGLALNYFDPTGIRVVEVDERTVQFLLEEPDSFFLTKTLVGLLPEHLLGHLSISEIPQDTFHEKPIGTGPYQLISISSKGSYADVRLEPFPNYYGAEPHIATLHIRAYQEDKRLMADANELDGIRNPSDDARGDLLKSKRFNLIHYQLPQYVAVFINTETPKLKNELVRLALQLATDKAALGEQIGEQETLDTPLLEIDQSNWVFQHSFTKANGALVDAGWSLPDKDNLSLPSSEAEFVVVDSSGEANYINSPNEGKDFRTTQDRIVITGTNDRGVYGIQVNDYKLQQFQLGDTSWTYIASLDFNNLKKGVNRYDVYALDENGEKTLIDHMTIYQGTAADFAEQDKEKVEEANDQAAPLPIRRNADGEELILRMIVPESPEKYTAVAEFLKQEWRKSGIGVDIQVLDTTTFTQRLNDRDYDLLIFGQNLGYNLDAYPYWHSSQAKAGGFNLSQFKDFSADSLLENARLDHDLEARQKTLGQLQDIFSKKIPAVFLYRPTYSFALSKNVQNASFENLATISDRFASISNWYARVDRELKDGTTPWTFIKWIFSQF